MSSSNPPIHADPSDSWHGVISSAPGSPFPPDKNGRYHLYIGLFCPFAHRANLVRHLFLGEKADEIMPLSVVKPYPKGDDKGWPGWRFPDQEAGEVYEGATQDRLFGSKFLHEVYFRADKEYKGRYSVPLLWDTVTGTAVCNESAEIMRWLPTAFDDGEKKDSPLYPEHLRSVIDDVREWLVRDLCTGVYKAGFAPTQFGYEKMLPPVFAALNKLEMLIHASSFPGFLGGGGATKSGPYILGDTLTELDILAYVTLVRFDVVYVQHFKCNLGTIRGDYPVIHAWLRNLYWNVKGFKETTDFRHIKENYTKSHDKINPLAITPMGPFPDMIEADDNILDVASLTPGAVRHPAVLEYQKTLPEVKL